MVECSDEANIWIGETRVDNFGGEIQLIDIAVDLESCYVNIETPWGDSYSGIEINKGNSKTYTSNGKTYSVHIVSLHDTTWGYAARIYTCYDFVEYLDTTLSMRYDSSESQLVEEGKIAFDLSLKDENNVVLVYSVDMYINNVYERTIYPDDKYIHYITPEELGNTLTFQVKFDGLGVYNASQSSTVSVTIPSKSETNLSIIADKTNIVINETVTFTGTLKDDSNNILPNQGTLYLVYKGTDGSYGYVLDKDGYKIIASTDSSGNYYRPWEATEDYLEQSIYAIWYEGSDDYNSSYSPNITLNISLDECIQNIKIQDQDYNPVENVTITIDSVIETTDIDGLVSFTLIRDVEYTVYKSYGDYSGDDVIIGCKLDPQILHIVTQEFAVTGLELSQFVFEDRTVVRADVAATGTGSYRIKIDGVLEWGSHNYPEETSVDIYDLTLANHTICADTICKDIDLSEPVPKCIDYLTQEECEDNDCYWWSDNTCQSSPEGTTDYLDIYIKPYSWYDDKYEEALNSALILITDLSGKVTNYMSDITGYEYNGVDILEDTNKNIIIVRIYLKDINEAALVAPLVIAGLAVVTGAVLIGIGFVIGTSLNPFSSDDVKNLVAEIVKNAKIDAYEHAYDIDKSVATSLIECLETIETCEDSLTCFENNGVTPSVENQMEALVAYETVVDAAYTGAADIFDNEEFETISAATIARLELVITKLEEATITPEGAACEASNIVDDSIDDLEDIIIEDCVFDMFGECIVTKSALNTMLLIGAGAAALIGYSAIKK